MPPPCPNHNPRERELRLLVPPGLTLHARRIENVMMGTAMTEGVVTSTKSQPVTGGSTALTEGVILLSSYPVLP